MTPKQLIEKLQQLPEDKPILCQVVPSKGRGAWNMDFEFFDIKNSGFVQLRISHPELEVLPENTSQ